MMAYGTVEVQLHVLLITVLVFRFTHQPFIFEERNYGTRLICGFVASRDGW
jgi:hypothetical protein